MVIMNEYFFLAEKVKPGTAFAYTERETPLSHELIPEIKTKEELPFDLVLKKVTRGKGNLQISNDLTETKYLWVDYQPNNLAWPLMSDKLKSIISSHLTGKEGIVWIKAKVKSVDESREYFIPRFKQQLEVLDEEKTTYVPGTSHIIRPVFSLKKIINYNMFHAPQDFWEITSGLYISESLKKAIQKEKLAGLDFEKISVA